MNLEPEVLGGFFLMLGYILGAHTRRKAKLKDPAPICGCEHHRSFHDLETGVCHAVIKGRYLGEGEYAPDAECTCRKYHGPLPLDAYYAPEITS
jgi:hypothetical protein